MIFGSRAILPCCITSLMNGREEIGSTSPHSRFTTIRQKLPAEQPAPRLHQLPDLRQHLLQRRLGPLRRQVSRNRPSRTPARPVCVRHPPTHAMRSHRRRHIPQVYSARPILSSRATHSLQPADSLDGHKVPLYPCRQMKIQSLLAMFLLAVLPCLAQNLRTYRSSPVTSLTSPHPRISKSMASASSSSAKTDHLRSPAVFLLAPRALRQAAVLPTCIPISASLPMSMAGSHQADQHGLEADRIITPQPAPRTTYPAPASSMPFLPYSLPISSAATDHFIRAEGYLILYLRTTQSTFKKPLASIVRTSPGQQLGYASRAFSAKMESSSQTKLTFTTNGHIAEDDLRNARPNYDPHRGSRRQTQRPLKLNSSCGIDLKQISSIDRTPPCRRASAQSAPASSRNIRQALPATDTTPHQLPLPTASPTTKKPRSGRMRLTLPDGIILIPHALVERLQNDSQIAAVLADKHRMRARKAAARTIRLRREKSNAPQIGGR